VTTEKSSLGMDANIAALLSYLLGWITGIIFWVVEKDSKFVKFHAMQSIVVFGAFTVLQIVVSVVQGILFMIVPVLAVIFGVIYSLIWLAGLVLLVILMLKAYQGETFKLPVAGDFAEKQVS